MMSTSCVVVKDGAAPDMNQRFDLRAPLVLHQFLFFYNVLVLGRVRDKPVIEYREGARKGLMQAFNVIYPSNNNLYPDLGTFRDLVLRVQLQQWAARV